MKIRKIIGDGNEQLIGGNFLNDTSGSYSSLSSFKLETNFTGKINTNYDNVLTSFSNPISLESINLKESDSELISTNKRVELNFDKSDLKSYIRFGSVVDYMKSAIHNIILDYPASLYIDSEEYKLTPLNTISDYIPNIYLNKSNFKINSNYVINKFGLIYNKDNLNIPDDNELRNLNLSYQDYVVYYNGGEYNILNFIGSYNGFIDIEVEGLPFGEETLFLTNKTFHIKPKPIIFNKIRKNFGKLENYFLQNRLSDNSGFEIIIKEPFLMDDGRITYQDRKLLWPTTDGYNIDYEGGSFNSFVDSLINISNNYDNTKTDLINRFLTPPSLKIYDNTQEKKIEKLLRIWGRNFDEIKQYIDALTKINKLSYDKKNNIPDVLVKNLARSFGWDDITLVKDDELINNFFAVDYEEKPTDFLPVEIDIELWRRILINTNFFWKTKGTRQAILAMFKLIGIPEPFINIKEYIYTVDEVINPDEVDLSLEDLYSASLPYTENGYPVTPIETNNFFFQISGDTDNGQHYMNNFRKSGFVLNQIEDNKKSWVYSGETIREHGSTVQYYQESSDLVLNTKQVDISLDIANAVEYDVFDYIKNVDYPNNSPEYAKKFTFVNINTDFETSGNTYELPEEPIGDVQVSLNGITLTNSVSGETGNSVMEYDNIFGVGFNSGIRVIIQDSNGKYLIGGQFSSYQGVSANNIIRLNQDGSVDNTFNIGSGFNGSVYSLIEDSNGKYLIGGTFETYQGVSANRIIRLNQDGSRDNTFNIGSGFNTINTTVYSLIEDSNGKYLIGGIFETYQGVTSNNIIRLNQDGSRDNTFNIGTGFNSGISSLIEDSNGKYLIGGVFETYQGVSANRIIRLNQDGSRDNTFNIGTGFNSGISSLIEDSNGKYLIGGNFTTYQGVSANKIIRLNQDGSRDNTFNIGVGFNFSVHSLIEDSNNKYIIGGNFNQYNNEGVSRSIIRLNQDGSRDNTFNIGSGFNGSVYSLIEDSNNKYIIGGNFNQYNNEGVSRSIIRLDNSSDGGSINIDGDYYIDENNSKLIHLNNDIKPNDVIVISYLFKQNNNEDVALLMQTIKYVVTQAIPNNDGSMIILPEEPNGDVQITMNGISLSKSGDNFIGDYSINPNNTKQLFISNDTLKDMILNNNNIVQLSYLTSESGYDLNQRSEFYKINNFNSTKLYFDTQINRFVYVLNLKVNDINDIRFTLNGITLSPEKDYQLSTTDKRNILLPPQIQIGDVLGFYYVTSESGVNDLTVPDSFGVGDISNLSFLEFVDLLEKKLINVKNRKVITDNKGGFYPTLLRVYIQYLKRSELDDEDILHSNGYTYDNLYEFLNKYNSFFYNFTQKLLPATVIYGKSGFMIRNTVFSKQKFTYKRGVSFNIVDGVGVPNNDLEWLGTDGSEFRVLQSGGMVDDDGEIIDEDLTILINTLNTYYYKEGNCYTININIITDTNMNINNKILISGLLIYEDNSTLPFSIVMDNINTVNSIINGLEKTPKAIQILSYQNQIGSGNYIINNTLEDIMYNNNLNIQPTFEKLSILNATVTQRGFDEVFNNNLIDIEFEMNNYVEGVELEIKLESDTASEYFTIFDFNRDGNYFSLFNHELSVESGGILKFNDRLDNNIISCDTKYFVDTNEYVEYTFIPYVEPQPNEDKIMILQDSTFPYYFENKNCSQVEFKLINYNNNESIYSGDEYEIVYDIITNGKTETFTKYSNLDDFNILYEENLINPPNINNVKYYPSIIKLKNVINTVNGDYINIDDSSINLKYNDSLDLPPDPLLEICILNATLTRLDYLTNFELEIEFNESVDGIFFPLFLKLSDLSWVNRSLSVIFNSSELIKKQGTNSTYIYNFNKSNYYGDIFTNDRYIRIVGGSLEYINADCNRNYEYDTLPKELNVKSNV